MRGHIRTDRLDIDTALCTACGACVEACPSSVLRVRGPKIFNDRHIHIIRPSECTGCLACVTACVEGAIKKG